ncbi:hypothetical protein BG004_007845 [Podila humilis]|nr:hypothetical protein BG004_007845 [Podila humilis]
MHKSTFFSLILACLALLSIVAAQAQCGPNAGSCADGNCCSSSGFCGNTPSHCGSGCQVGFGNCESSPSATTASSSSATDNTASTSATTFTESTPTTTTALPTTTASTTTTSSTTTESRTSTSAKGTFQLQPTGKPSGASAQEKGVKSTLALVIVFIAGLFMV